MAQRAHRQPIPLTPEQQAFADNVLQIPSDAQLRLEELLAAGKIRPVIPGRLPEEIARICRQRDRLT